MPRTFSAEDFAKALASDSLIQPLILSGMVKKSEEPETILFAPETSCRSRVSIPLSKIEKVEWLGTVSCKDHFHEYVRIFVEARPKGRRGLPFRTIASLHRIKRRGTSVRSTGRPGAK